MAHCALPAQPSPWRPGSTPRIAQLKDWGLLKGRTPLTRYPQDRASVLATTLISILVRRLRAPEVHAEIAQTLREEFHDIARQARDETRPSGE